MPTNDSLVSPGATNAHRPIPTHHHNSSPLNTHHQPKASHVFMVALVVLCEGMLIVTAGMNRKGSRSTHAG